MTIILWTIENNSLLFYVKKYLSLDKNQVWFNYQKDKAIFIYTKATSKINYRTKVSWLLKQDYRFKRINNSKILYQIKWT